MKKQEPMEDRKLVLGEPLVNEPTLIRIQTIRAKFLDQIESYSPKVDDIAPFAGLEIVGRTRAFMVFIDQNGLLKKVHLTDYSEFVRKEWSIANPDVDKNIVWNMAYKTVYSVRQLFED